MNICWTTFSVTSVIINLAFGLPDPGLVEVQDGWNSNVTLIQPDGDIISSNQETLTQEVSPLQARKDGSSTSSRCVKKNIINYVTEYENMMQCNIIYQQECHQVPKQVCSITKINPKQIEIPYSQTICYNDDDDDGLDAGKAIEGEGKHHDQLYKTINHNMQIKQVILDSHNSVNQEGNSYFKGYHNFLNNLSDYLNPLC